MLSLTITIYSTILLLVNATKQVSPPDPPEGPIHDLSQCQAAPQDARETIADLQMQIAQRKRDNTPLLELLVAAEQCEIDKAALRKAIQEGDAALQA